MKGNVLFVTLSHSEARALVSFLLRLREGTSCLRSLSPVA